MSEDKKTIAEDDPCPECDQVRTDDGCDCRAVCCCVCATNNKIYNMQHMLDKETDDYEQACFAERIDGYYCHDCDPHADEEEEEHNAEYFSEEEEEQY